MRTNRLRGIALGLIAGLALSTGALAAPDAPKPPPPRADAMVVDLLIARPLGVAATIIGSALYVASLPFSVPAGNSGQVANVLVVGPARYTFSRPLGEFSDHPH